MSHKRKYEYTQSAQNYITVSGMGCTVYTNGSRVTGMGNTVIGDDNVDTGMGNVLIGCNNQSYGMGGCIREQPRTFFPDGPTKKKICDHQSNASRGVINVSDYVDETVMSSQDTSTTGVSQGQVAVGKNISSVNMNDKSYYIMRNGGKIIMSNKILHYEANSSNNPIVVNRKTGEQISGPKPVYIESNTQQAQFEKKDGVTERYRGADCGIKIEEINDYGNMDKAEVEEENELKAKKEELKAKKNELKAYKKKLKAKRVVSKQDQPIKKSEQKPIVVDESPKAQQHQPKPTLKLTVPKKLKQGLLPSNSDKTACVVCEEKEVCTLFAPCGHANMCNSCCIDFVTNANPHKATCPICAQIITGAYNIYM